MMDSVLIVVLLIAILVYRRKDIVIDRFVLTLKSIGLHIEISAKEKNCTPRKDDSSAQEN